MPIILQASLIVSRTLLLPSVIHPGTIFQMTNPRIISIIAEIIFILNMLINYTYYNDVKNEKIAQTINTNPIMRTTFAEFPVRLRNLGTHRNRSPTSTIHNE